VIILRDMISVYYENKMKPINILWPEDLTGFTLKEMVNVVTSVPAKVMKRAEVKHQFFTEPSQYNKKYTSVSICGTVLKIKRDNVSKTVTILNMFQL
jgi:hypothetical protein